jgi:hypothetical protein
MTLSATSVLASVVMIANMRSHSPVLGSFQFSQMPAIPKGEPFFMAMAYGCFRLHETEHDGFRPEIMHKPRTEKTVPFSVRCAVLQLGRK